MPKTSALKKPVASVKNSDEMSPDVLAFLHVFALGCGKIGYKTADAAIEALLKQQRKGSVVIPENLSTHIDRLLDEFEEFAHTLAGKKLRIVDGWRGKMKVNTGSNVRRFELEEVSSL